jgi:hypothetical protein
MCFSECRFIQEDRSLSNNIKVEKLEGLNFLLFRNFSLFIVHCLFDIVHYHADEIFRGNWKRPMSN